MPQDDLHHIDRPALVAGLKAACHAAGTVDMRQRTPAEIAEQLQRDATSLELTGASFEKDEQFYRHVAANVREAAGFLAAWQGQIDQLHRDHRARTANARRAAVAECTTLAMHIRDANERRSGVAERTWYRACDAIVHALHAREDGEVQS